jgi:hypothetical protein
MSTSSVATTGEEIPLEVLWEDGDRIYCRTWRNDDGVWQEFMAVLPTGENPSPDSINPLSHEYGLKEYLDDAWALRPLELARAHGRPALVLKYREGKPLDRLVGPAMVIERFLRLAITLSIGTSSLRTSS